MNDTLSGAFLKLVSIMDDLREKCPWDRKQTIQSLRQLTIEETYELADAITNEDWKGLKEELGDLLLHILFYAKIGNEQKKFDLEEVITSISEKLIFRHPHIYGDAANGGKVIKVADEEEVKRNWEKLKLKEGKKSILGGVPASLPATVKAMRLQEKAKQVGFEWENKDQVWEKVEEEMKELKEVIDTGQQAKVEEEFGDLIFSLINYARFLQVDAENALELTNKKFIHRFTQMEQQVLKEGKDMTKMSLTELDDIWNSVKQHRDT
ncbi:nucleoside triphosphate pyrophosphohydrolase [Terrimonas pollutisoli]|uniref:nucleoside triphosphate pyrophosphohydrolase n=1 Tax=Terrimonas pollutisoli TaxID=3034147 RepID=UPI0023EDDAA6|nr:nucleoside triphosphate pyrophosphohydrolase [Terrimonas sp. H1YJ31]